MAARPPFPQVWRRALSLCWAAPLLLANFTASHDCNGGDGETMSAVLDTSVPMLSVLHASSADGLYVHVSQTGEVPSANTT